MKILFLANSNHIKPAIVLQKLVKKEWINSVQFSVVTNGKNGRLQKLIDKNKIKSFVIDTKKDLKHIIHSEKADYLICCGWNSLLPSDIITLPKKVSLNCHSSYLPDYKGASVFKHYWSNWENQTGATVHIMDKKFDTGNIVAQKKMSLKWYYTPKTILKLVSSITADLIIEAINQIESGDYGEPQKGGRYFYKISNARHILYWFYNGLATTLGFPKKLTPHKKIETN